MSERECPECGQPVDANGDTLYPESFGPDECYDCGFCCDGSC